MEDKIKTIACYESTFNKLKELKMNLSNDVGFSNITWFQLMDIMSTIPNEELKKYYVKSIMPII